MNENMEKICRTCLSTENELLLITSEIEDNYRIIDYFNECLNIKMNENDTDDNLPKTICLMCLDNLLEVRKFYKKCVESEKYLKHQKNNKIIIKEENLDIEKVPINNANTDNDRDDGGGDEEFTDYEMLEASTNNTLVDSVIDNRKQNKLIVGFSCIECNEDFKYEKNYRLHLKIDHGINEFVIQDELYTNNDESVTDATDNATKNVQKSNSTSVVKNYKCEICDYAFRFLTNYDNHMRRHGNKKKLLYQCPHNDCIKSFYSANLLHKHVTNNHLSENNSLLCQYCGRTSDTKDELKYHVKKFHKNYDLKRKFKCNFCESSFYNKNNLISHERRHTDERPFKCKYCDKTFRQSSALNTHITLHTGKLIKCDLCDKRFSRKGFLKVHMRSHTNERPYACPHCPQRYNQKCHLKSHLASHSFERPYKCRTCGMTFAKKHIFRGHLFTHAPKPYKCPECSLETASVFWFRKHLRKAHNMEDVDIKKYKRKIVLNSDIPDKPDVHVIVER